MHQSQLLKLTRRARPESNSVYTSLVARNGDVVATGKTDLSTDFVRGSSNRAGGIYEHSSYDRLHQKAVVLDLTKVHSTPLLPSMCRERAGKRERDNETSKYTRKAAPQIVRTRH